MRGAAYVHTPYTASTRFYFFNFTSTLSLHIALVRIGAISVRTRYFALEGNVCRERGRSSIKHKSLRKCSSDLKPDLLILKRERWKWILSFINILSTGRLAAILFLTALETLRASLFPLLADAPGFLLQV